MRRDFEQLSARELVVLNLGPDSAPVFAKYWREHDLPFPGLADPDHQVARRYQQPIKLLKLGRMPMQVLVDQAGVIRWRHEGASMRDIPTTADVLLALDQLEG